MNNRAPLEPTVPLSSYFICTSPRSGSTLLEHGLEGTCLAGCPKEYYDSNHEFEWEEHLKFTPETYFEKIFQAGTTPNGVFAAKLFWFQAQNLAQKLGNPLLFDENSTETVDFFFPKLRYIWLRRRDKVRQAVSWVKADVTGIWRWIKDRPTPIFPDEAKVRSQFSFKAIDKYVTELSAAEISWGNYFKNRDITPLEIYYEDMVGSFGETVLKTLQWLEIELPPNFILPEPRLIKQADHISEAWVADYLYLKTHPQITRTTAAS